MPGQAGTGRGHPRRADDAAAQAAFDQLSYSNKRRIVLSVEGAKAAETRARRIDRALGELRG